MNDAPAPLIVTREELARYSPERYDAVPLPDGRFRLVRLTWWDDASYAAYQGDSYGGPY